MQQNYSYIDIPLVVKLTEVYKQAHRAVYRFPKFERYALGERLLSTLLDTLSTAIGANTASRYEKERYLVLANAKIETAKILYRIARQSDMCDDKTYLDAEVLLRECGKMTQGWLKHVRALH
jgi:hypothetical protein